MVKKIFITGTDTDCGKTVASCKLLAYLQQKKYQALGLKPVASGTNVQGINEDIAALNHYNFSKVNINLYQFKQPIAPHLAALTENNLISFEALTAFCNQTQWNDYDYLLIEGAGGLLVPLYEKKTWLDFIMFNQLPVILIVGMRLGCINHALLTNYVLQQSKVKILGWIANFLDANFKAPKENLAALESLISSDLLGIIDGEKVFYPKGMTSLSF